eukprot:COSAG06_NODE_27152_length_599_cov_1.204000_1_plen_58_part_10
MTVLPPLSGLPNDRALWFPFPFPCGRFLPPPPPPPLTCCFRAGVGFVSRTPFFGGSLV